MSGKENERSNWLFKIVSLDCVGRVRLASDEWLSGELNGEIDGLRIWKGGPRRKSRLGACIEEDPTLAQILECGTGHKGAEYGQ